MRAACLADSTSELDRVVDEVHRLERKGQGVILSGFVDMGYVYQFSNNRPNTQGYTADQAIGGEFNVNQLKLVLEKPLSGRTDEFEAGFRVDLLVGEDAAGFGVAAPVVSASQSFYLQQAYVELMIPWADGLQVQFGLLNPLLGFEADERVYNLNITQGLNSTFDPGPSGGILATCTLGEHITLIQGIINGSLSSTSAGIAPDNDGYAITGALAVSNPEGNAETQWAYHYAPFGDPGLASGQTENEALVGLNWVGTWAPLCLDDHLLLGYNLSYWWADEYSTANPASVFTTSCYARYQWNDWFSTAGRVEYTHDSNGQWNGFAPSPGSDDLWGYTCTLGIHLFEDLLLRSEYRVDWGNDVNASLDDDVHHSIAFQVAYEF
ncbi:MAG: outer membrane beta-barrel protein [Verrucomicrobiota bacterium]